ncbi:mannose-P-dolichol utilization defect 1 [Kwoniella mangroviensis CBS 10435]|uniref:Mannose-P-dolichol utilization defect 1 protein homolog n=1 Tax=Kwoniella mangroviensis CBS 10435 TaxID=1331196 RepID=A0A1B9ISS3_9TREE|nr:mannose-P-dolichol utilization defect 1 [Kwoniella mangroviensis CBS 8507]OCF58577.1 mannose-P-dolichol utilization defect 1 [Kwoniella mangroviensis CBS 10435]OCF68370.1 mannose-P-dolichol utilization defect 1 [Kwoniella mangroviensis CBS 8507]
MSALHSAITSITQNIPSFLRQPAEALIGEQCYDILVYNFDITHVDCLKYALSKGLGLGIVVGGGIVKIPQILKIVGSGSARGLSLSAYILETASYAINLAYASRNRFPFSTYGENFFLTIQNVIITLLILFFSTPRGAILTSKQSSGGNLSKVITGLVITLVTGVVLWSENLCPPGMLALLQAATLPLSLISKAPQILSNHKHKSTGNLSAFAVFNALLGCLARLFTTQQEVDDPLIFWGFAGAAVLNAVLALQMIAYWKNPGGIENDLLKSNIRRHSAEEKGTASHTSPEKIFSNDTGVGKRWARKVD